MTHRDMSHVIHKRHDSSWHDMRHDDIRHDSYRIWDITHRDMSHVIYKNEDARPWRESWWAGIKQAVNMMNRNKTIMNMINSNTNRTYEWVISYIRRVMAHMTRAMRLIGYETWLIHTWDMTHSYVRHARTKHRWFDPFGKWRGFSFVCETWFIHTWDMTHSNVRHDSYKTQMIWSPWKMARIFVGVYDLLIHTWYTSRTQVVHTWYTSRRQARVECRGLSAFARRNTACVFRKII